MENKIPEDIQADVEIYCTNIENFGYADGSHSIIQVADAYIDGRLYERENSKLKWTKLDADNLPKEQVIGRYKENTYHGVFVGTLSLTLFVDRNDLPITHYILLSELLNLAINGTGSRCNR